MAGFKWRLFFGILLPALFGSALVFSPAVTFPADTKVGAISFVKGKVYIKKPGKEKLVSAGAGAGIFTGDIISTSAGSKARIIFIDGSFVDIASNSKLMITLYFFSKGENRRKAVILLMKGKLRAIAYKNYKGKGSTFIIKTSSAIIQTNRADLVVTATPAETEVAVLERSVSLKNVSKLVIGEISLKQNQSSTVKEGMPPTYPVPVTFQQKKQYIRETTG